MSTVWVDGEQLFEGGGARGGAPLQCAVHLPLILDSVGVSRPAS